jgi:hypothetical protein
MSLAAIWEFIVGDSRVAPAAVVVAIVVALVMLRTAMPNSAVAGTFMGIIALGLAGSIFERR